MLFKFIFECIFFLNSLFLLKEILKKKIRKHVKGFYILFFLYGSFWFNLIMINKVWVKVMRIIICCSQINSWPKLDWIEHELDRFEFRPICQVWIMMTQFTTNTTIFFTFLLLDKNCCVGVKSTKHNFTHKHLGIWVFIDVSSVYSS